MLSQRFRAVLEMVPLRAKQSREQQPREPTHDRHEAPAAEEAQITRGT